MEHHTDEQTQLASMEGPPPGTVLLDKYRVDWMLGVGGYGYVLRAQHLEHGENVAIKILRDDREADAQTLARFQREGRVVAQLKSEHVARVLDVGKLPDGQPYMVMELLEGDDLGKILEAGPLKITDAVDYILQACEALAEAHNNGIVHRDIKPGNLFLAKLPAKRSIIKVLDFGISKTGRQYDKRLTQTQSILGTPAYMAPEQMRDAKTVDFRADIWALGAVLYELVEGLLPFDADNFAELVIAVSTSPIRPMRLAPELESVLVRCLAKRPDQRFDSVAQLASALAPFGTPATSREYVARIHRLLGNTPPPEDIGLPPPRPTPIPMTSSVPPMAAMSTELVETLRSDSWERVTPRRRWLPFTIAGAIAATIAIVVFARSSSPEEQVPPARPEIVEPAPEPPKPKPEPPNNVVEPPKPDPTSKPAPDPTSKPTIVVKKPPVRPPVKPPPRPPGAGSAVDPPPVSVGRCSDGSLVASHRNGCPKKR